MESYILSDETAMVSFGVILASFVDVKKQTSIYFQGEIGAGKTTLIRSLLRTLGVKGSIKSPTFSVMESYSVQTAVTPSFSIHHFDLYRLVNPEELEYLGWREAFLLPSLCCIEWPEKAQGYLPEPDIFVSLKITENGREVTVVHRIN